MGKTLGNISEACRKIGVSRQHYYDIKKTIQEEGLDGLYEKSRYALMGGFAVALWGGGRSTVDLDFLVNLDDIQKIDSAMTSLGQK